MAFGICNIYHVTYLHKHDIHTYVLTYLHTYTYGMDRWLKQGESATLPISSGGVQVYISLHAAHLGTRKPVTYGGGGGGARVGVGVVQAINPEDRL